MNFMSGKLLHQSFEIFNLNLKRSINLTNIVVYSIFIHTFGEIYIHVKFNLNVLICQYSIR